MNIKDRSNGTEGCVIRGKDAPACTIVGDGGASQTPHVPPMHAGTEVVLEGTAPEPCTADLTDAGGIVSGAHKCSEVTKAAPAIYSERGVRPFSNNVNAKSYPTMSMAQVMQAKKAGTFIPVSNDDLGYVKPRQAKALVIGSGAVAILDDGGKLGAV